MSTDITSVQSATKTPRRRSKTKKSGGPTLSDRILKILSSSKERAGVSMVALKKALAANGYDVARNNAHINLAVKRLVANGKLKQTKGTGASGSFKMGTKSVTKSKKPKAKKIRRKKAKKPAGAKKTPKKSRRKSLKSPGEASETAAFNTKKPRRPKRRASKSAKAKNAKK
ncbi:histone H1.5 [Paramisgurnus dabryanus]|uniref:histone H1.5 n=1 Tax=Paramisgurnus dabryanus TaxID=90735 RepID=UPI0031F3C2A9